MSEAKKEKTTKKAVKKPRINKVEAVKIPVKEKVKATETPVVESVIETTIIEEVKEKMEQSLLNIISVQSLEQDLEILVKALECRQADIKKAEDTGAEYFIKLLGNMQEASKDLESIKIGLVKIKQYSE